MKFSGSKKCKGILIICMILLFFSLVGFSFREAIKNGIKYGRWFTVDKYQEFLKKCEYSQMENGISFQCQGLLESMSVFKENDNGICYQYKLFSQDQDIITSNEFCEDADKISLYNPYKELNKILPVSLVVSYKQDNFYNYKFQNISMKALSENEIDILFKSGKIKLTSNKDVLDKELYGPYSDILHYQGICCASSHSSLVGEGLFSINLLGVTVEKAFTENDYLYFILNGYTDGFSNKYTIKLRSKGVVMVLPDGTKLYLNKDNFNDYLPSKNFDATVSYTTTDFSWRFSEFQQNCLSKYSDSSIEEKSLCDNITKSKTLKIEKMLTEDKIKELISNKEELIINELFLNYIYLK